MASPIRRDPTGQAGNNVGDEIDLILNFHVARYSDVMVGYSKLFGGGFLERTSGNGLAEDAELLASDVPAEVVRCQQGSERIQSV